MKNGEEEGPQADNYKIEYQGRRSLSSALANPKNERRVYLVSFLRACEFHFDHTWPLNLDAIVEVGEQFGPQIPPNQVPGHFGWVGVKGLFGHSTLPGPRFVSTICRAGPAVNAIIR